MAFGRFIRSFSLLVVSCQIIVTVALVALMPIPAPRDEPPSMEPRSLQGADQR